LVTKINTHQLVDDTSGPLGAARLVNQGARARS